MNQSEYPLIRVSDILDCNPCEEGWREAVEYFGDLQRNDKLDVVKLLKWKKHTYWLIKNNLINLSHQDAMILYASPQLIRWFAVLVEDADITKLQNKVISFAHPIEIRCFAQYVKNADIIKLEDAIITCADILQIKRFVQHVKHANIAKLNKAIEELTV